MVILMVVMMMMQLPQDCNVTVCLRLQLGCCLSSACMLL